MIGNTNNNKKTKQIHSSVKVKKMSETSIDLFAIGVKRAGPRFNKKMSSYQYRKSHCGDKTILRPSYLRNGISYTGKTTSLYWIGALVIEPPFIIHDEALSINGTVIGAKRMTSLASV